MARADKGIVGAAGMSSNWLMPLILARLRVM